MLHLFGVVFLADQAHAGCGAAADLVLQTGPRAIAVVAVLALAHLEYLLQEIQAVAHGAGAGIGAEVAALPALGAPVQGEPRKLAVRQVDIGVGFVVTQQDVVDRLVLLDQVVLQQQRLDLAVQHSDLDVGDVGHHRHGFRLQPAGAEVAGNPVFQVFGLAHVQQPPLGVVHLVHAGALAQGGEKGLVIETAVSHG